jgi:phospholipid/cholesterol/gamma-HCH transport system ATP-binding protein
MPERKAVARRQARVRENLHLLPKDAQAAILESLEGTNNQSVRDYDSESGRHRDDDPDTASIAAQAAY